MGSTNSVNSVVCADFICCDMVDDLLVLNAGFIIRTCFVLRVLSSTQYTWTPTISTQGLLHCTRYIYLGQGVTSTWKCCHRFHERGN